MKNQELKRLIFYLDGLKYSIQMADLACKRLRNTLDEIAQNYAKDEYAETQITSSLLDAWIIVDMCHRVRELVQQTPGLSKKIPQIQVFLRGTAQIEKLRHYVQHFRSGIPKIPYQSNPLWGALSWVPSHDKTVCYTIFSGNQVGGTSAPSLPFDLRNCQFAAEIKLFVNGMEVDPYTICDELTEIRTCITKWLDQLPNFERVKGRTMVSSYKYKVVKPPAPPA